MILHSVPEKENLSPSHGLCRFGDRLRGSRRDPPHWATIADLSVGGCYVEMAIPLPPGTKLKVGIWIGETKAWADAEVAHSCAGLGTGVMFIRTSEPDLDRIRQFLGTLPSFTKKPM